MEVKNKGGTEEKVVSERQIFSISGPTYLSVIDWKNFNHRRSVAASLVQGVYILERDRQQNRQGSKAQATHWWNSFHFQLIRQLIDNVDNSIFGAVYEFKPFAFNNCNSAQDTPRYVIAFRGTIQKPDSFSRDLKLDLLSFCNRLHQTSRFQVAMQAVQELVDFVGAQNIWLAGHSLGSAIALLAGKNMTKIGYPIEAYLFNPPFLSAPIENIKNEKLKHGIRITSSVVKAGLASAIKRNSQSSMKEDAFVLLSNWLPYLFVNPADPICSEYIGYFEHRKKMEEIGAGKIGKLATQKTFGQLLSEAVGKDLEALHLIPSAYLTINLSKSPNFNSAHGIHQWWNPNLTLQYVLHQFK